jgi:hypothetical protein
MQLEPSLPSLGTLVALARSKDIAMTRCLDPLAPTIALTKQANSGFGSFIVPVFALPEKTCRFFDSSYHTASHPMDIRSMTRLTQAA